MSPGLNGPLATEFLPENAQSVAVLERVALLLPYRRQAAQLVPVQGRGVNLIIRNRPPAKVAG